MARTGQGAWIAKAQTLRDETAAMSPAERRRHLEERHRQGGLTPNAAIRCMKALRWLEQTSETYGINLGDVVMAWTGVEILERLESSQPYRTTTIIADALLGRLTAKDVIALASPRAQNDIWKPGTRDAFVIDRVGLYLPPGQWTTSQPGSQMSEWAKTLKVDVEWTVAEGGVIAVFLAPGTRFAKNRSFADLLPRLIAARVVFDRVVYVSSDPEEAHFMQQLPSVNGRTVAPLEMINSLDWEKN